MKNTFYIIASTVVLLSLGVLTSSCTKDLNAYPLNETDYTSETAYGNKYENYVAGLTKIYRCFSNTSDLTVDDAGASELVRAFWCIQECSTDACKNDWEKDAWTQDINKNTWSTADNAATYAVYARTLHGITYTNEFLRQTTDDKLERRDCSSELISQVHELRAEARFIRAYMYWMAMDTFGDVPFVTEESEFGAVIPEVAKRSDVFNFIESELVDLTSSSSALPAARSNYPRVDKGSAWGLLSRLYLNAQVYNATFDANGNVTAKGAAKWAECKAACEEIFKLNYGLCSNYFDLFRGDNGENPDANQEFLFALYYDAVNNRSWGGTCFLVESEFQRSDDQDADGKDLYSLGVADGWAGIRMPAEFAKTYFGVTVSESGYNSDGSYKGTYNYVDKRAANFFIKGHTEKMSDLAEFTQGWSYYKFNNIPHDVTREAFAETAATYTTASAKASIDYPMIRLAEIYLNYAEACLNLNQDKDKALVYLNEITERAGLEPVNSYDMAYIQKERAVELSWEGLRRIDLIRWDLFNSGTFLWKWKGGSYEGQAFPDYKLVFDFPSSELISNSNLSHKPGYSN
ncbi:MAG: RagB/SusD family nutrient uptake outer membrane protein [Bacteroidales bacterium]